MPYHYRSACSCGLDEILNSNRILFFIRFIRPKCLPLEKSPLSDPSSPILSDPPKKGPKKGAKERGHSTFPPFFEVCLWALSCIPGPTFSRYPSPNSHRLMVALYECWFVSARRPSDPAQRLPLSASPDSDKPARAPGMESNPAVLTRTNWTTSNPPPAPPDWPAAHYFPHNEARTNNGGLPASQTP